MSDQPNQLEINTDLPEPGSPKKQNQSQFGGNVLLSPKNDGAQKLISQQSPSVMKNKLEVLRKLYQKTLEQRNALEDFDGIIHKKKEQLDGFKTLLDAKKSQGQKNAGLQQKRQENKNQITLFENQLLNVKANQSNLLHEQKISQAKQQIQKAHQKLIEKEKEIKNAEINSLVNKKADELQQIVKNLQYKKNLTQNALNGSRTKVIEGKNELQSLLSKLLQHTLKLNSSVNLNQVELRQKNVEQQIYNRKEEIQILRAQLQFETKRLSQQGEVLEPQLLAKVRDQIQEQKNSEARVVKQIEETKKEVQQSSNKVKTNEKVIEKQKGKNGQLSQKSKKLEEQKSELQQKISEVHKKPKYEQKVPEELLVIRKRKEGLQKEVKTETERTQKQRSRNDQLIPPTVLQNFKQKIQKIHQRNQRHAKLVVQNAILLEENKKLDIAKQQLQWEINPQIKNQETNRIKQQGKYEDLELEVNNLRKKNIQVSTKLQEYVKQYPQFKPEKKVKKQQPAPQPVQSKKQSQQEDKNNKKKKQTSSKQPSVQQVQIDKVLEQQKPAVPQNKKTKSKKQESKSPQNVKEKSPTLQVKQNKKEQITSKKQEQQKVANEKQAENVQKKEEKGNKKEKKNVQKQSVNIKQKQEEVVVKKQEAVKSEQLKLDSKQSVESKDAQGKKNKKKKL